MLGWIYHPLSYSLIVSYKKAQSTPFIKTLINILLMEGPETLNRTVDAEMLQLNWVS